MTTFGYKPRWSPDGSRILFVQSAVEGIGHGQVYTVGLDGSPPMAVDTQALSARERNWAAIGGHADSQRVAFASAPLIATVPTAGEQLSFAILGVTQPTIVRSEVDPRVQAGFHHHRLSIPRGEPLVWAPDEAAVYFIGVSGGLGQNLWSVDVNPQTLAIIGGPHRITTMPQTNESTALSRTGTRIAFAAVNRNPCILSYSLENSGLRLGEPPTAWTPAELFAYSPDLTPSGSKILFKVQLPGSGRQETELRVMGEGPEWIGPRDDPGGQRETRFASRWSPDGTSVAYRHIRPAGADPASRVMVRSLVVLDVKTEKEAELTTPFSESKYGDEIAYGWSPDGQFIVSSSGRYQPGHRAIALLPVSKAAKARHRRRS